METDYAAALTAYGRVGDPKSLQDSWSSQVDHIEKESKDRETAKWLLEETQFAAKVEKAKALIQLIATYDGRDVARDFVALLRKYKALWTSVKLQAVMSASYGRWDDDIDDVWSSQVQDIEDELKRLAALEGEDQETAKLLLEETQLEAKVMAAKGLIRFIACKRQSP